MVGPTAGAHRGLLEGPQPRDRLAGVPHQHVGADGLDEATGEGGHPRQVAGEVQRRALGGEDGGKRARHPGGHRAGRQVGAVGEQPLDAHRLVDLGEGLVHTGPPGEDARGPRRQDGGGPGLGRHQ